LGRWGYSLWLLVELLIFAVLYLAETLTGMARGTSPALRIAQLANWFVILLIAQHFLLVIGASPTLAAGSITEEKTRKTLGDLLNTSLSSWDIVRGKWLGQFIQVLVLSSVAAPSIGFVGALARYSFSEIAAITLVTLLLAAVLTSAGIVVSVWCRKTTTAVFAVWFACAVFFVSGWRSGLYRRDQSGGVSLGGPAIRLQRVLETARHRHIQCKLGVLRLFLTSSLATATRLHETTGSREQTTKVSVELA